MASVAPTPQSRRKKQTTYGKTASKAANTAFFDDDDNASATVERAPKKFQPKIPQRANIAVSPPPAAQPASPARKQGALPKLKRSPPRQKDLFDVPSDEETAEIFSNIPLPPKQRVKNRLVDEPREETEQLAPWEKKLERKNVLASTEGARASRSKTTAKPEDDNMILVKRGLNSSDKSKLQSTHGLSDIKDCPGMTASERLKARRRKAQENAQPGTNHATSSVKEVPKRSVITSATIREASQNKRRRITPQPESPPAALNEVDNPRSLPHSGEVNEAQTGGDVFDVPMDEDAPQPAKITAKKATQSRQRSRAPGNLRRVTPQKGVSAPSRLQDMIPGDEEYDFPMMDSTSPQNPTTPLTALKNQTAPSTPPSGHDGNPAAQKSGTMTPKQTQMWADLLEPAGVPNTGMRQLSIFEDMVQAKPSRSPPAELKRSSSDVPARRTRIVDRLKASATNSSEDESSQDEDDSQELKSVSDSAPKRESAVVSRTTSQETESLSQKSQRPDRPIKPVTSGSQITYAKQRSYLTDDNIESALMFAVPMGMAERPAATARRVGKTTSANQPDPYDLDDADAPTGGLRTIHELRAGGRNTRLRGEIEDLLGEIADHATTARSRRRGALLDLVTKLMDKSFAEQVFSHGFEHVLLVECRAPSDPPADFLLASTVLLLLYSEPPKHALATFEEALPFLGKLIAETSDISKAVKERRSNMSRSAQEDIVALAEKLKSTTPLWGEYQPIAMSSRTVALKAIDIAVGKLRQELGNKSDLLDSEAIAVLVPKTGFSGVDNDVGKAFETSLIISILEALKTLAGAGDWPAHCIDAIATLPALFETAWQAPQKTKWLAYRLCANITNDSSVKHDAFTKHGAVRHLMAEVVSGFHTLHNPPASADVSETDPVVSLDFLLLAIGTLINLTEDSSLAQQQAVQPETLPSLTSVIHSFLEGQKRALQAESVAESTANVAYGYLAIMLANVCQESGAREVVRGLLPGKKLDVLVEAVEEFVRHHQRVDGMTEGGGEGFSGFTERLMGVLVKLKGGEVA